MSIYKVKTENIGDTPIQTVLNTTEDFSNQQQDSEQNLNQIEIHCNTLNFNTENDANNSIETSNPLENYKISKSDKRFYGILYKYSIEEKMLVDNYLDIVGIYGKYAPSYEKMQKFPANDILLNYKYKVIDRINYLLNNEFVNEMG